MQLVKLGGIALVSSLAFSNAVLAGIIFSDDFDGPTTFYRPRENNDGIPGVHPPDVGVDPWGGNGRLRDGSDVGYPGPGPNGGVFYAEPYPPRMIGNIATGPANSTENNLVSLSWDFYVQGYAPGGLVTSGLELCTWDTGFLAGPRGTDFWLQADGSLQYYTNSGGFTQVPSNEFSFATDQWNSAQLLIDHATGAATLNIGTQSKSFTVADPGANRIDSFHIQNDNDSGNGKVSFFDNIVVNFVDVLGTWGKNAGGDWNLPGSWSDGTVPNAVGAQATLGNIITAPRTVYADTPITVGTLIFDSAQLYNLSGAASLSLEVASGTGQIGVVNGSHKINLPTFFASDTNINIASGATLTLADPVTIRAGKTVSNVGNGSLLIQAPLTIEGGGTLAVGAAPLGLFGAASLVGSARINVGSQSVNFDYRGQPNPASTIEAQLTTGYADGAWTGEGIMTSASDSTKGLGWVDDTANQNVKVKLTYYGDTNLSGTVDSTDFSAFVAGYGETSGGTWANGDFNYDDKVNTLDFNMLAGNFGAAAIPSPALGSVVPEPATAALLALGGLLTAARRRSR